MKHTRVRLFWREPAACRRFCTAVSLHNHTMHSRENLGFIPKYAAKIPPLAWELRRVARLYQERTGRELDYTRGYFTPPLPPANAVGLERRQIEEILGLQALVSLTDHDNIDAACLLRAEAGNEHVPVSVEWTLAAGPTHFHIGLHNLPPREAASIMAELVACSQGSSDGRHREILHHLHGLETTLVVLNHPLWDQAAIGPGRHRAALEKLLEGVGGSFHAMEINGLRSWPENRLLLELARASGHTVVAGGDRHGCEPTAMVNLTNAASFAEFVSEVRAGVSEIAILDRYREPRGVRILRGICDIMGHYPEFPGRARWSDRVYVTRFSGSVAPISEAWSGELPGVVRGFERLLNLVRNSHNIQKALRICFANSENEELNIPT